MDVKVLCQCGAKFQFPIEPVDGRMPVPVKCPVCGVDATEAANAVIAQKLAASAPAAPAAIPAIPAIPAVLTVPPPTAAAEGGPKISIPTITMEGDANGAPHPEASAYAAKFSGRYEHRTISGGIGHNLPQEAPEAFAQAILDVDRF